MFIVCVCARARVVLCLCTGREPLRRADHPPKESYRLFKIYKTEVKQIVSWRLAKADIGAVEPKKKNWSIVYVLIMHCQTFQPIV
jgi:hypothetical protein